MPPRRRRPDDLTPTTTSVSSSVASAADRPQRQLRRQRRVQSERPRSRWPRRLGILFLFLVGLILVGPNLIGWFGLQQMVIDAALSEFDGHLEVQGVTLGWFQPIQLSGIKVNDATGEPLAEVETIRSSNRLGSFLFSQDLGRFEIVRPKLILKVRPGGSNLEDSLARYLNQPASDPASDLPKLSVSILEGSAQIIGAIGNEATAISQLKADIQTGSDAAVLVKVEGSISDTSHNGGFQIDLKLDEGQRQILAQSGRLNVVAQKLPLGALSPVLQRVFAKIQIGGELNGVTSLEFAEMGNRFSANMGQIQLLDGYLEAPTLIGEDRVQVRQLVLNGSVRNSNSILAAEEFAVDCDFGKVNANGQFAWQQLAKLASSGQLSREPFQLEGHVDLARLASLFPSTLRVYDDLQFESGQMQFQLLSKPTSDAGRLLLNVDTTNVAAVRNGQRLAWQQPLRLVADIVERGGAVRVEELNCLTDFLTITGQADLQRGNFTIHGDLAKLLERAGQFVDMSGWQLSGGLDGRLNWDLANVVEGGNTSISAPPGKSIPIAWNGQFTIDNPVVGVPEMPVWREAQMQITSNGAASIEGGNHIAVNSGEAKILVGQEQAELKLREPVTNLVTQTRWVADWSASGSLASWLKQIETFVDLGEFEASGNSQFHGLLVLQMPQLQLTEVEYDISQLAFAGYGLDISEPQVKGQAKLSVDLEKATVLFEDMTLASSSVAARGERVQIAANHGLQVSGAVGFRADVNRVSNWFGISSAADSVNYFGTAEGSLTLSSNAQSILADVSATIPELIAAQRTIAHNQDGAPRSEWNELLKEGNVRLTGRVGLGQDFDQLTFEKLAVDCSSLGLQTDGLITDLAGKFQMDMRGTWNPNWEKINGLLAAYSSNLVQLTGGQNQTFFIRGPLFAAPGEATALYLPTDLEFQSQLGWNEGKIGPLPMGAAQMDIQMAGGIAALNTGAIPFSGGTIRLSPRVDFRSQSPTMLVESGPLAENITLSPEICRDWLKYVAPLLADVTSAQGSVSINTEGIQVPLSDPLAARVRGQVQLNQVTVGAGPLASQLIETVQGIRTLLRPAETDPKDLKVWMKLEQQSVPFTVQDKRVYHEGLALTVRDITLRTKGSVGFDQSLSMVAEIPISDSWLGNEPWLQGLKGQALQIPVGGTVTHPVLDKKAIQQLSMQLVQRTAANQLNNVVGDQAQKLQGKVDGQINKFQNDLRDKFKSEVGDKLQGDFQQGLDKIFGPPKKDK